jgi:hypothetical protein
MVISASLALISTLLVLPTLAGAERLYWSGDVSSGSFAEWQHVHDGRENPNNGDTAAEIIEAPGRPGELALRLVAANGERQRPDRAEVGNNVDTNRGREGQESYYHFEVYFPGSNRGKWSPEVWDHNSFFQFIGIDWAPPAILLGIDTGDYGTDTPHMFFNNNVARSGAIAARQGGRWDLGEVPYDTWIDFVIRVRWSANESGLLQAWMNGEEVVPLHQTRTMGNAPVIMEIQNYRPGHAGETAHIFDEVRVGDSFDAVH